MIGCYIWVIVLGKFDMIFANYAMSRINMLSREGYLKSVKRIFSDPKIFPKGRVVVEISDQTTMCTLLRTTQIGWNSIQILKRRFQRIFLLEKGQGSG
jgi:hypothetical protein